MYIIELFIKLKNDIKQGKFKKFSFKKDKNLKAKEEENKEEEKCDHLFVPIDSTGRVLACSKCGMIYKRKIKKTNPFKEKED